MANLVHETILVLIQSKNIPSSLYSMRNVITHNETNILVFNVERHNLCCTATEDGYKLELDCTIYVLKTKALISFAVTTKLIGVFVFAYGKY